MVCCANSCEISKENVPGYGEVAEIYLSHCWAMALPDLQFPGKGVVARGGDYAARGTTATLEVTFTAKSSTAEMPGGIAPVAVVAGVRYTIGYVVGEQFDFEVAVP